MKQSPNITIREATAEDAVEVAGVLDAAFAPLRAIYRPTDEVAARQIERAREGTRLVAELDGQVVQFDSHEEHIHVIGFCVWVSSVIRSESRNLGQLWGRPQAL